MTLSLSQSCWKYILKMAYIFIWFKRFSIGQPTIFTSLPSLPSNYIQQIIFIGMDTISLIYKIPAIIGSNNLSDSPTPATSPLFYPYFSLPPCL